MPAKGGGHMLYRVDRQQASGHRARSAVRRLALDDVGGTSDFGTARRPTRRAAIVHDPLVVYTPAARARVRPSDARKHDRRTAVAAANQADLNSKVNITLNLVGLQEIDLHRDGRHAMSVAERARRAARPTARLTRCMRSAQPARRPIWASHWFPRILMPAVGSAVLLSLTTQRFVLLRLQRGLLRLPEPAFAGRRSLGHSEGMHYLVSSANAGAFDYLRILPLRDRRQRIPHGHVLQLSGVEPHNPVLNPDVTYNGWPTGISYEADPANSAAAGDSIQSPSPRPTAGLSG